MTTKSVEMKTGLNQGLFRQSRPSSLPPTRTHVRCVRLTLVRPKAPVAWQMQWWVHHTMFLSVLASIETKADIKYLTCSDKAAPQHINQPGSTIRAAFGYTWCVQRCQCHRKCRGECTTLCSCLHLLHCNITKLLITQSTLKPTPPKGRRLAFVSPANKKRCMQVNVTSIVTKYGQVVLLKVRKEHMTINQHT